MNKKTYIYNITLTNGELLKNIRSKGGSLQLRFNGIGTSFVPVDQSGIG
ncbi:hypothetical protein [Lentibacillus jeotgali]|nr:hypothetical protein [Lentibacillus jeotgali]